MPYFRSIVALAPVLSVLFVAAQAGAQEVPGDTVRIPAPVAKAPKAPPYLDELKTEAEALNSIVESPLAKAFLATAPELAPSAPRLILRDPQTKEVFTPGDAQNLVEPQKSRLRSKIYDTRFFYTTGYGSPAIYARPLDILAAHGLDTLKGKRVMDFGYGMIGQERMMALLGADVHGIDVEPLFALLYSQPGDQGEITAKDGTKGSVTLHNGQWPADARIVEAAGRGYDVIISKNVLKAGYIHPAREANPETLVHLGVSDEEFLKAAFDTLKPGGLFLAYNISPKQAPEDKPYIPWADGKFPFERTLAAKAGFEVLAFDQEDDEKIREVFAATSKGRTPESFNDEIFSHYTLLKRPATAGDESKPAPAEPKADAPKASPPKPASNPS
jgi:hypothetical protein